MKISVEKALLKLQDGDTNALADIYDATSRGVFTFILPIVKDYALAEDVMEQTYIAIYEKINLYKPKSNGRNWILTIAKNLAINEFNKNKKYVDYDYNEEKVIPEGLYSLDDSLDTPTIKLANEILSEEEFNILIMYTIGEYKHREIAELLHLPLGTVTWKYKNALQKLRDELNKRETNEAKRLREENR